MRKSDRDCIVKWLINNSENECPVHYMVTVKRRLVTTRDELRMRKKFCSRVCKPWFGMKRLCGYGGDWVCPCTLVGFKEVVKIVKEKLKLAKGG